jgi:hypothetical protein
MANSSLTAEQNIAARILDEFVGSRNPPQALPPRLRPPQARAAIRSRRLGETASGAAPPHARLSRGQVPPQISPSKPEHDEYGGRNGGVSQGKASYHID